jgi:iron complex outermembrane receptor protein
MATKHNASFIGLQICCAALACAAAFPSLAQTPTAEAEDLDSLLAQEPNPATADAAEGQGPHAEPAPDQPPAASAAGPAQAPTPYPESIPVKEEISKPAEAAPAKWSGRTGALVEEIIVTAQKREENIQDVPISITAFSGEALDVRGITNPEKLALVTPGLIYDSVNNFALVYLRGVGTDAFLPHGSPSVATYIDGVYFPFIHEAARGLGEIERIEVLKGPQGTLFGVNSTGGAISITTKAPDLDEFHGHAQASYGSYNKQDHKIYLNIPMGGEIAMGIGALYQAMDEVYKPHPDSPVDKFRDFEEYGARMRLRWKPSDVFDATLTATLSNSDGTGTTIYDLFKPFPAGAGLTAEGGDYIADLSRAPFSTSEGLVTYLNAAYLHDWFDVKSVTAYQDFRTTTVVDYDGAREDIVAIENKGLVSSTLSQEIQLLSNSSSPDWLKWVVGLNFFGNEQGFERIDFYVAGSDNLVEGLCLNVFCLPDVNGLPIPFPALLPDVSAGVVGMLSADSRAGFFHVEWDPLSWAGVTVAGRYQVETRKLYDSRTIVHENNLTDAAVEALDWSGPHQTTKNFSPKVSLNLRPFDSTLLFASWQRGFKSATFNIINLYSAPKAIKPERIETFEVGVKTDFFDGDVRVNAAVFENRIQNLQTQFISFLAGGVATLENAAEVSIKGAEIDVTWAATDSVIVTLGGSYLDGRFDSYPQGSGFDPTTGVFSQNMDFTGNRTPRTPEFSANASLVYAYPLRDGDLEFGADYFRSDDFFFDNQNLAAQEAFDIVNLRLSYFYEPWGVRVTGFGENLTEPQRYQFNFVNDFGINGKLLPPAVYGVRVNWQF